MKNSIVALIFITLVTYGQALTLSFTAHYNSLNGNISIQPYDSDTGNPWVGIAEFAVFDFNSTSGVFTGTSPNYNPAPTFPPVVDTNNRISSALLAAPYMTATYDEPYDLGNVAQAGLTQAFIDSDFTSGSGGTGTPGAFTYNYAGGGSNKVGQIIVVPESSMYSLIMCIAILGYVSVRRRCKEHKS